MQSLLSHNTRAGRGPDQTPTALRASRLAYLPGLT